MQAITMLAFNAEDAAGEVRFESLLEKCNYSNEHLKRVLHSLSCGKNKVIVKTPVSATIKETDSFKFNPNFVRWLLPINDADLDTYPEWAFASIGCCRYSSVSIFERDSLNYSQVVHFARTFGLVLVRWRINSIRPKFVTRPSAQRKSI